MNRRTFLGVAAGLTLADAGAQTRSSIPVIDTHIHLYDPSRPQGVPWPNKENKILYQTSLPPRYRQIVEPLGIVGAIEVECSPWLEDNQWVLDIAQDDTIMVGTVGRLVPGTPEFRPNLERFHKNPLYRGIRYGLGRQAFRDRPQIFVKVSEVLRWVGEPELRVVGDVQKI
jgi:L-fuconolactonase